MNEKDIVKNGESLAMNELLNTAGVQNRKYRYAFPFTVTCGAAGSSTEQVDTALTIAGEGDFLAQKLAMKLIAATAKYGLLLQVYETGYGKQLFRDYVDTVLLASPGFSENFYPMIEFKQLFLANSTIKLSFKNTRSESITAIGAFHGHQFVGSAKNAIPGY